jgi:hypothetical protein
MWARRGNKSKLNVLISKWPVASDEDAVKHAVLAMIVVKARLVHGRAVVDDKQVAQLVFVHIDELRTDCNFQKFVEETLKRLLSVRSGSFLPCRAMVSERPEKDGRVFSPLLPSARPSSVSGKVRPCVLAVFMLMISSTQT